MNVQLLYFQGCPNIERAREVLRQALTAEGVDAAVEEIDVGAADAPAWTRGWGSPTILIDGVDTTGATQSDGAACRLYQGGAPTIDAIRARLASARGTSSPNFARGAVLPGPTALPMLGAITAALAASACCLLPALLAVVGVSGAGLGAALAPYRIPFLIATAGALGLGFWLVYRKPKAACDCEVPRVRRGARAALWITTAVVVALAAYPLMFSGSSQAGVVDAPAAATLRLNVTGMDCRGCTGSLAKRLQKVPGVVSASVDYDSATAVVRHDGRPGLDAAVLAAVADAGFAATVAP